ncbi:MAG: IPTL-CTERM sorting domain-containing protein [Burkholderiales bacterium]
MPVKQQERAPRTVHASLARRLLGALAGFAMAAMSTQAFADAALGTGVNYNNGSAVSAGQTGIPAVIDIENTSTPDTITIQLNTIQHLPSCGAYTVITCTTADPGVFVVNPLSGTGRTGTACAGMAFTFTSTGDALGTYNVTWSGTITLAGQNGATNDLDKCLIDFTVDVVGAPDVDASVNAGLQTRPSATSTGTGSNSTEAVGFGTTLVTVNKATPGISTTATAGPLPAGSQFSDSATLSGGFNPTGSIVFRLFGPSATPVCSDPGNLVYTSPAVTVNGNGVYSSPNVPINVVGTYYWIATYSGDSNNDPVSGACGDSGEASIVSQDTPTMTTTASASTAAGNSVTDTATLANGTNPTGSITFKLYGPVASDSPTCIDPPGVGANLVYTSNPIAVNGNGNYVSAPTAQPTQVGWYYWVASYSGDANNAPVSGACGDSGEKVQITKDTPTLSTTASAGGVIGVSVTDTASAHQQHEPDRHDHVQPLRAERDRGLRRHQPGVHGERHFRQRQRQLRSVRRLRTDRGRHLPLDRVLFRRREQQRGQRRLWRGGGDGRHHRGHPLDDDDGLGRRCVGVATVSDQANLSGGYGTLGGTITFRLYGPSATNSCTGSNLVFTSAPISVNGTGVYSSGSTPALTTAGTYRWIASYSGDANNNPVAGTCGDAETVVIDPVTPTLATTASVGGVIGVTVTDSATLSNGFNPQGNIVFRLYGPSAGNSCTPGNLVFTSNAITVNGNGNYGPSTLAYQPQAAGTYRWIATYTSTNANNSSVSGNCGDSGEIVVIEKASPALATSASTGGVIGVSVTDSATLSNSSAPTVAPTGSITFTLYGPSAADVCIPTGSPGANQVFQTAVSPISGNGPHVSAPSYTPTVAGTYRWIASYSGDANNNPVSGSCGDPGETVTITKANPAIATTASAGGLVGVSVSDAATLSGTSSTAVAPTGSITFTLYGPNPTPLCTGNQVFTTTLNSISGNGPHNSASFNTTGLTPGNYYWIASYSGDANNNPVAGICGAANETVALGKTTPTLATTASAGGAIGVSVTDSATLGNTTVAPTGSITYTLYGPNPTPLCSGNQVFQATVNSINGNGPHVSPSFPPTTAGTYYWIASYSGDANYNAVSGACGDSGESVTIARATPTLATSASAGGAIGVAVTDSATLSNTSSATVAPTGSITFTLYGPNPTPLCSGNQVFATTISPIGGNGPHVSASFQPTTAGTYYWIASYSGDTNNNPVAGACGDSGEAVVINPATPTLVTQTTPNVFLGTPITDTATLSGGVNPTGSITFNLYGPNDATCANAPVFTSNAVTVNGNGAYVSTPSYTPLVEGTYRWIASYTGDGNNNAVSGACNDAGESVVVTRRPPDHPVPTLSQWALLLASLMLAGTAIATLRRPRRR